MTRKKAAALPQPEPERFTIYGDIIQETEEAILLDCGTDEPVWLPKSQIEYVGERGDQDVEVSLPEWLADEKDLGDGQGFRMINDNPHDIIRESETNQVEVKVEAIRVTNHTTGIITWYDKNTGEVLRDRAINLGEQLPLELAGEAADHETEQPTSEPETVILHGTLLSLTETEVNFVVDFIDQSGTEFDGEFTIPREKVLNLRTSVLNDEKDAIILNRSYALEAGIIGEPEQDSEPEEATLENQNSDEQVEPPTCDHGLSGDDCQICPIDCDHPANFVPMAVGQDQPSDIVSMDCMTKLGFFLDDKQVIRVSASKVYAEKSCWLVELDEIS